MLQEEKFMTKAIEEAASGMEMGHGGPFGAVIVKDGKVLSFSHNKVLCSNDPTRHAEINAISEASKNIGNFDLSGCTVYTTTEPCPMCFAAIHWARIDEVVYGTTIQDVSKLGFNELVIPAEKMKEDGKSRIKIRSGFMLDGCRKLLKQWQSLSDKQVY